MKDILDMLELSSLNVQFLVNCLHTDKKPGVSIVTQVMSFLPTVYQAYLDGDIPHSVPAVSQNTKLSRTDN